MVEATFQEDAQSNRSEYIYNQNKEFTEILASYNQTKKCYLLSYQNKTLEVPKNWGPFKNRISTEFELTSDNDHHHFLAVLSDYYQTEFKHLKFTLINSEINLFQKLSSAA
ncbi:MAG: hypothetical protein CME62_16810 [Halobacteriovoraceae bacterium]|nr:hypothetical protein [Halobacteriovoraceae bacterium]